MNILPKKSWHVRNKDNVARVRRDEAKAKEEEEECARRRALAEQEARIVALRARAQQKIKDEKTRNYEYLDLPQEPETLNSDEEGKPEEITYTPLNTAFPADKHINLFEDFEEKRKKQGTNKDYENEKRKMQEDYEKKIGYLTYLGQSASSQLKKKPWYDVEPKQLNKQTVRSYTQEDNINRSDPLNRMQKYLSEKRKAEDDYYGPKPKRLNPALTLNDKLIEDTPKPPPEEISSSSKHKKSHKNKKSKHKKHKKRRSKSESPPPEKPSITIEELREQRRQREKKERERSINLIKTIQGRDNSRSEKIIDERNFSYNTRYNLDRQHTTSSYR